MRTSLKLWESGRATEGSFVANNQSAYYSDAAVRAWLLYLHARGVLGDIIYERRSEHRIGTTRRHFETKAREAAVEPNFNVLAQTGDSILPLVVGGIVVVALIVLVVAFILMRRR